MERKLCSLIIVAGLLVMPYSLMLHLSIGITALAQETPKWGGTLVWTVPTDPNTLNPIISPTSWGAHVLGGSMFMGLTAHRLDENGQWEQIPQLAESWEVSSDGLAYTYHLFRNITWHDGEPFTSADVKFSYGVAVNTPKGGSLFAQVTSVETPDNYTVVFKLSEVVATFLTFNVFFNFAVIPKHLYTNPDGTVWNFTDIRNVQFDPEYIIGTGPFVFKEYAKGSHVRVERNPNYFKEGLPYLDAIVYKIVPDPTLRALLMAVGEADYWPQTVGVPDITNLEVIDEIEVTKRGMEYSGAQFLLFFNLNNNTILQDNTVRKAISYAIDRDELSELASGGLYAPGKNAVNPSLGIWHNPDALEPLYDAEMAEQLLDQAGYPRGQDGVRFTLRYQWDTSYSAEMSKCADILADQLGEVGIHLQLIPMDSATFSETTWVNWDYDLTMWPFGAGPDPNRIANYFHSRSIKRAFGSNSVGYNNSVVDSLFDEAVSTTDQEVRKAKYWEIQEILAEDLPVLHLLDRVYFSAYRKTFINVINSVWGFRVPIDECWWTEATGTSPPGGTDSTEIALPWTEIAVVVVVVGIVVAAGVIYYRRRPK